ncbi:MAG: VOC family protein [Actinomycetota bacterium]|nr:VOC family protein [Actinomycetota bacterium]
MTINGVHAVIHSKDAGALRAWFRDILGYRSVDAGDGWLIFALPPAELGIHPAERNGTHELYLLCDDIEKTVAELNEKGVPTGEITDLPWGRLTTITAPEGSTIAMYEPTHPKAIDI